MTPKKIPKAVTGTPPRSKKIILVDDRTLSRSVASIILRGAGFDVEEVSSGADCLSAIDRSTFDIALIDIQMPGMNGYELASEIRTLNSPAQDMALLAASGDGEERTASKALASGFDAFIAKPLDADRLVAKITDLLAARQPT